MKTLRTIGAAFAATALFFPSLRAQVEGTTWVPNGSEWEYLLYAPEPGFIPLDPATADAANTPVRNTVTLLSTRAPRLSDQ